MNGEYDARKGHHYIGHRAMTNVVKDQNETKNKTNMKTKAKKILALLHEEQIKFNFNKTLSFV